MFATLLPTSTVWPVNATPTKIKPSNATAITSLNRSFPFLPPNIIDSKVVTIEMPNAINANIIAGANLLPPFAPSETINNLTSKSFTLSNCSADIIVVILIFFSCSKIPEIIDSILTIKEKKE